MMRPLTADQLADRIVSAIAAGNWPAANHWADQLHYIDRPKTAPSLAGAALWYAEQGLAVFPLQPGLKVPQRGSHGLTDATVDPDQIRRWWTAKPDANIGLITGQVVDVVDIDGPTGVKSWAQLLAEPEPFGPVVGTVNTPRPGGTHLYVPATGLPNSQGRIPGIDYRGRGGYVVAPPSINEQGRRYSWRSPLTLERIPAGEPPSGTIRTATGQTRNPDDQTAAPQQR